MRARSRAGAAVERSGNAAGRGSLAAELVGAAPEHASAAPERRGRARRAGLGARDAVALASSLIPAGDAATAAPFLRRLRAWWPDVRGGLVAVYGDRPELTSHLAAVVRVVTERWLRRATDLRALDEERVAEPDWFEAPDMLGYVFYVDRFGGSLRGVEEHLDYLAELGVRYVHLMPLLATRDGDNDGGYAVADYGAVRAELGTMDDLERLTRRFRAQRISTCIDLVINHTAAEHPWARRALAGDPEYEGFYRIYPDRIEPDRFEAALPEVFPDFAPGNFTRLANGRWVWTTFNEWQWDLNWSNPRVFSEMLAILLDLANRGVDVFRLDAVAFLWKRLGTNSQNQPEVHQLLRALRACARIAAPAVVFKAEAIVGPDDLAPYLGVGRLAGKVCDLAYQNSLMVQFWSALATRDTRLMTQVMAAFPTKPPTTAWATYIRCHDDIGWAVTETDAERVGWTGPDHRAFLSDFYTGRYPGSFAVGAFFQHNAATGDSRVSGTLASLAGLERAEAAGDPAARDRAIARILLGHALILSWDGLPLLYMGDEIGLLNDASYLADPSIASDNRWMHRPWMDWERAATRNDPDTSAGRISLGIRRLMAVRRDHPQFHAAVPLEILDLGDPALFALVRRHPEGSLLAIFNFTEEPRKVSSARRRDAGLASAHDLLDPTVVVGAADPLVLPPYGVRWLVDASSR